MTRTPLSFVCVSIAVLALAACSREAEAPAPGEPAPVPEAPPSPQITYACEGGGAVGVRYLDSASVEVEYRGQTYVMRIAHSASGARYVGSGLEWWTAARDGTEQATLSRQGQDDSAGGAILERCSRPAASVLPPPARDAAPSEDVALTVTDGAPPCRGPALSLARESGEGAAGSRFVTLSLTNEGSRPCSLTGHPGLALRDAGGRPLAQMRVVQEAGGYYSGGRTPGPVTLAPGAKAWFDMTYSALPHEDIGETRCPTAASIAARAPGDSADIPLDMEFQPCGRQVRVTPVRPVADGAASD